MNVINNFRDDQYEFLMNSYPCTIEIGGEVFPSVEHAFQALKATNMQDRDRIRLASTAREAKKIGRSVDIVPFWDQTRVNVMHMLLEKKFSDPELAKKLLSTRNAKLVSGGDTFWGKVDGVGENQLGKLLMHIRKELVTGVMSKFEKSAQNFLEKLGWKRIDTSTDDSTETDECWVPSWSPNCQFDLTSAVLHQLRQVQKTLDT